MLTFCLTLVLACGEKDEDSAMPETAEDTAQVEEETAVEETGESEETGTEDTGSEDTAVEDTAQ
jgi:hypothetical protein